jgi:hypothetical protein
MKRLLFVSAVFCGAALIPLAAQAQRGGAHGGFGGGHVGGAVSHGGAGFSGAGARIGGVRPVGVGRPIGGARPIGVGRPIGGGRPIGTTRPVGLRMGGTRSNVFSPAQRGNFSHSRFMTNRFRNHFEEDEDEDFDRFHHQFFNDCFNGFGGFGGFGCFNPFFGGLGFGGLGFGTGFFDPFLFGDFGQQQQQPQQQPVAVQPDDSANRQLAFEVQAIQDEIQALRSEERAREQARTPPPPPKTTVEEERGVTLVFRDGRQLPVHNYAVADHTIWVLGPNVARKIPASDLDLDATEQVNAKNGVEFHVPH